MENGNVEAVERLKEPSIPVEVDSDTILLDLDLGSFRGSLESMSSSIPLGVESDPSHAAGSKLVSIPVSISTTEPAHPTTGKKVKINAKKPSFPPIFLMTRNRIASDSALLASASGSNAKHDVSTKDNGKAKVQIKTQRTRWWERLDIFLTFDEAGLFSAVLTAFTSKVHPTEEKDKKRRKEDDEEGSSKSAEAMRNTCILTHMLRRTDERYLVMRYRIDGTLLHYFGQPISFCIPIVQSGYRTTSWEEQPSSFLFPYL
ncbi:hypothetical protein BYT27DRAFT_7264867 [Phlegmacium glaucopus]|nr:hypothetical protein BYT27DRAFT_7264867 [Phlegmacium glaucopus]